MVGDSGRNTAPVTTRYTVRGMTCDHCVMSVTEEVTEVAGVIGVEVDLATGLLHVAGDGSIDDAAVRVAVEEAGYTLDAER